MKKLLFILLIAVSTLFAADSPGVAGFQFLKMQVGARAAGMAGAFAAIPNDIHGLFYNPASVAGITQNTAGFSYQDDLLDFNSGFMGYVRPDVGPGNLGISMLYRDYGMFDKTDIDGNVVGDFSANNLALAGSYAMHPLENVYAGASVKYIRGNIENYSADAIAFDAGAMYLIPSQQLGFALNVSNLGFMLSQYMDAEDSLPLQVRLGLSKRLAHLPLLLGLNLYRYSDSDWYFSLGGEFTLTDGLFLRLGYDSYGRGLAMDSSKDTFAGAAIGLGAQWNKLSFDYAYTTLGELGGLNRFTLSGHF